MAVIILQALLLLWFFGCIKTYRLGKILLVEGMGVKSAEFFLLCLYLAGLITYHAYYPVGKWVLIAVLTFWIVVQFFCHWYYTIFGCSAKKLAGYNKCFKDTYRLIPISDKRLIPDLYHTVLHLLIIANIISA